MHRVWEMSLRTGPFRVWSRYAVFLSVRFRLAPETFFARSDKDAPQNDKIAESVAVRLNFDESGGSEMLNTVGNAQTVVRGLSQLVTQGNVVRALVERKDYGADVELSNGRRCSLWKYAVPGPVIKAAVNWAKRNGAVHVTVRG